MDNVFCQYSKAVYAMYMEMSLGLEMCSTGDVAVLSRGVYHEEYRELYQKDKNLECSETTLYS